ncbi:anti-sigma factor [Marinobacter goseongensis]|uniref:anti-sigma factor n=1 Tax=Marinobacter goseongensis TaxID=453838 RepID=UPI002006B90F|nr:anti-sigma factor [Marinobacter goseongensis]MCK7551344.1 anti-sigma factor [Marinobacter goseongensis]
MTDHDNLDTLAAEFVLGTLPPEERASVIARREDDQAFDDLILAWEERLVPLLNEVTPIQPGPDLLARVEKRLDELEATTPVSLRRPPTATVTALQQRVRRWQWSTAVTSAAALVLVAVLAFQPAEQPQSFVAVFQHDDQQPAFMLTVDLDNRQLNIRPVTAEPVQNRSYQLWIKADELGPDPRSVGVLTNNMTIDQSALSQYDPQLLKKATFGISVEPAGGSPTGKPTGPAIHGYLYPTTEGNSGQRF